MKLTSYETPNGPSYGIVRADGIFDLQPHIGTHYPTLRDFIANGDLTTLAAYEGLATTYKLDAVRLLPPVTAPEKILCVGVNYADRNEEYRDDKPLPKYPSLFFRAPTSFVGSGAALIRPHISKQLDYEGEIALVIGKQACKVAPAQALSHIFGLTLCNEGTLRDWLHHGKFNVTQGKNFDRSGSLGPWIVTADEIDFTAPLMLQTRINGDLRQNDDTSRLIFSFVDLLCYITSFMTLNPGDLIITGTPTGAGVRFTPPRFLVPGDRVEIICPAIGVLQNIVEDEK